MVELKGENSEIKRRTTESQGGEPGETTHDGQTQNKAARPRQTQNRAARPGRNIECGAIEMVAGQRRSKKRVGCNAAYSGVPSQHSYTRQEKKPGCVPGVVTRSTQRSLQHAGACHWNLQKRQTTGFADQVANVRVKDAQPEPLSR